MEGASERARESSPSPWSEELILSRMHEVLCTLPGLEVSEAAVCLPGA